MNVSVGEYGDATSGQSVLARLLNPGLGWLLSCLGSFLGLRCLTRARAYTGRTRAIWLLIASVAVGGTGIWAMHFVGMLGYTIPGQEILYNVPMTVINLVAAISVVAVGLFIVGFGAGSPRPVLAGGLIMGVGVAAMHYFGMAAVSLHGTMRLPVSLPPPAISLPSADNQVARADDALRPVASDL